MKMDQPKYREKVLIGLEAAPPSFDVRGKVLGPGGANLLYITKETGAVVTLRGKDSGYIEANGHESIEPLHICVEHSRYEVLQAGRQLAFNLIETVQQEWAFQKEQLLQQPPPAAQGPPPAPPPQLQPPPPAPLQAQNVQLHPPQIVTSGQAVNTAPTHPDQHQLQVASATQNGNSSVSGVQVSTVGGSGTVLIGSSGTSATPLQQGSAVGSASGEHAAGGMLPTGDAGRPSPPHAQPTLQVQQPRQVFVSQQGSLLPQPAALIPQQQQVIPPGSLLAQQPHIIQASYPVQYMQTSNGQMVLAYPNIVRPVLSGAAAAAAATDPTAGHQVMLVQYGQAGAAAGLRPTLHHQAAALRASQPMLAAAASPVSTGGTLGPPQLTQPQQTATAAIPQIVQIVNPQTGQIQHVIQHIQPQLHMQQDPVQVQLGGSVAGAAGAALLGHQQVLMPVQQQLLTQLPGAAAAAALQFGTAAAATNTPHHLHHAAAAAAQQQQLIIAQQVAQQQLQSVGLTQQQQLLAAQTQVTSSSAAAAAAAGLLPAQQALSQPLPQLTQLSAQAQTSQASTNQHQPTVSVQSTVQSAPQQGQKRRYEGEQNQFQSAPPPPSHHTNLSQANSHTLRKGVGMEQRLQQNQQQSQQQVSQQQQQQSQQPQQQQQTQQQQQQSQEQQSQVQASADGSKAVQQDEWRQQRETVNDLQGMRDLVEKLQQDQVKRARPYHNMEAISSNSVAAGDQAQLRAVNKTADKPTTYLNYIQQQQQQQQQSAKQQQQQQQQDGVWQQVYQPPPPPPHTPTPGTPTAVQYLHQQHQVYQPPPQHPQFPPPTHQYNPWIVPQ